MLPGRLEAPVLLVTPLGLLLRANAVWQLDPRDVLECEDFRAVIEQTGERSSHGYDFNALVAQALRNAVRIGANDASLNLDAILHHGLDFGLQVFVGGQEAG
jgi:hypothetical protein